MTKALFRWGRVWYEADLAGGDAAAGSGNAVWLPGGTARHLSGCREELPDIDNSTIDFSTSEYKHITNGGVTDDEKLPYNVDAITGATLTVEGPGVVSSTPLSIRELENRTEGLFRGAYEDSSGVQIYEGVDLYTVLYEMTGGDSGIFLTDTATHVELKDCNRNTLAVIPLDQVAQASQEGRPILLAYGVGKTDGSLAAPFVFDAKAEGEHSLGYVEELDNEDGCLRLVYDLDRWEAEGDYKTFSNVAYLTTAAPTAAPTTGSTSSPSGATPWGRNWT